MSMNPEHQKDQQFDDIREIVERNPLEEVMSMKNESIAELNDDKSIQISERPMMFDAVSERQADHLIMYDEEQKASKSEKHSRIGQLSLHDEHHGSSDEDDLGFGFSFDDLSEIKADQALPFTTGLSAINLEFDGVSDI